METHMKTTINMADDLFIEAKKSATDKRVTLGRLIEDAVRKYIRDDDKSPQAHFKLADGSFTGQPGYAAGIDPTDWAAIRSLIYEGRGT